MLVVNANSPYKTLEEFIAGAKRNPGKLKIGKSGMGSYLSPRGVNIERTTGTKFNHIPYNEGTGPYCGIGGRSYRWRINHTRCS